MIRDVFCISVLVAVMCTAIGYGQSGQFFRHRHPGIAPGFSAGFFGTGTGFFSGVPVVPIFRVPRDLGTFLLADQFILGGHQPTAVGRSTLGPRGFVPGATLPLLPGHAWHPATARRGYFRGWLGASRSQVRTPVYSSNRFVQQWGTLAAGEGTEKNRLNESVLLTEGMSEHDIVRVLGSPLRRVELGDREVWSYSGFSLHFVRGELKKIQ